MAAGAMPRRLAIPFIGLPPRFGAFLLGLTISRLGDALFMLALPWIAYKLTESAFIMSTLYAVEIIPVLMFGAFAGVYVDRLDRRKLMMSTDLLRALIVALIPILQLMGVLAIWHLYVAAFALSLLSLVFDVANQSVIPEIAGSDLTKANAAYQLASQVASMAGPVVAGMLIAWLDGYNALFVDALSFSATFLTLLAMPAFRSATSNRSAQSVWAGMLEGLRWLWDQPVVKTLSFQAMTGNFGFGMVTAVIMFYMSDTLGLTPELSGLNFSMMGIGGILASVAVVPIARKYRRGTIYPLLMLIGMAGLLFMAAVRTWWAPGAGLALVSICNVTYIILSTSLRQELIPSELMGRVVSFTRILSTAAMPLGATLGGFMMENFNPAVVFISAAGAKLAEYLIIRFSAISKL